MILRLSLKVPWKRCVVSDNVHVDVTSVTHVRCLYCSPSGHESGPLQQ